MKKSEENKENVENVMNVWNIVGLRINKTDNIYEVRFNKISFKEPNKWFGVKFTLEEGSKVSIIECEPKNSLDSELIERQFCAKLNSKPDLRHLIVLIRQNLKKKNGA